MLWRLAKWTGGGVLLLTAAYLFAIASFRNDPAGNYLAFKISGHEVNDRFVFKDGRVTIKTCCGDQDYGRYFQTEKGDWVWEWRSFLTSKNKYTYTNVVHLKPGIFTTQFHMPSYPPEIQTHNLWRCWSAVPGSLVP